MCNRTSFTVGKFSPQAGIEPGTARSAGPIEMVWNQLKRYVVKVQPQNKDQLIQCIHEFCTMTMTPELCNRYINHVFKVAPLVLKMNGQATGDIPNRLFNERTEGKDMQHFVNLLETEEMKMK